MTRAQTVISKVVVRMLLRAPKMPKESCIGTIAASLLRQAEACRHESAFMLAARGTDTSGKQRSSTADDEPDGMNHPSHGLN